MSSAAQMLENRKAFLQVKRDFAGVRGRVRRAVAAAPRTVTFEQAFKQAQLSLKTPSIPSK